MNLETPTITAALVCNHLSRNRARELGQSRATLIAAIQGRSPPEDPMSLETPALTAAPAWATGEKEPYELGDSNSLLHQSYELGDSNLYGYTSLGPS